MRQASRAARLVLLLLASGSAFPGAAASQTLVGLRGRDGARLDRLLAAQQDPTSPDYRRWLTPQEFGRRFGASPGDLRRVERWLRDAGCRVRRASGR
jgi:subtilase family serine protease